MVFFGDNMTLYNERVTALLSNDEKYNWIEIAGIKYVLMTPELVKDIECSIACIKQLQEQVKEYETVLIECAKPFNNTQGMVEHACDRKLLADQVLNKYKESK